MTQYLVAISHPDNHDPSEVAEARVLEPAIWERLDLALVTIMALTVIVSVILFFAAAGGSI